MVFLLLSFIKCSSTTKLFWLPSLDDNQNGEEIKREVDVSFVRYHGDSLSTLYLRLTTHEPHDTMVIHDLSFIINENKINIVKNKKLTFKYSVGVMNGLTPDLDKINVNKYFGEMEKDDEMIFTINMHYSFDNNNIEVYEEDKKIRCYGEISGFEIFRENIFSGYF